MAAVDYHSAVGSPDGKICGLPRSIDSFLADSLGRDGGDEGLSNRVSFVSQLRVLRAPTKNSPVVSSAVVTFRLPGWVGNHFGDGAVSFRAFGLACRTFALSGTTAKACENSVLGLAASAP